MHNTMGPLKEQLLSHIEVLEEAVANGFKHIDNGDDIQSDLWAMQSEIKTLKETVNAIDTSAYQHMH